MDANNKLSIVEHGDDYLVRQRRIGIAMYGALAVVFFSPLLINLVVGAVTSIWGALFLLGFYHNVKDRVEVQEGICPSCGNRHRLALRYRNFRCPHSQAVIEVKDDTFAFALDQSEYQLDVGHLSFVGGNSSLPPTAPRLQSGP